jgi:ribonuclease VapC
MIVDASALVAILRQEPGFEALLRRALEESGPCRIAAPTLLETMIVVDGEGKPEASRRLDLLVIQLSLHVEPFTASQAQLARAAYRDFGKGSGHPAQLNYGDCMAYALALERGEPMLCKGGDFARTGIDLA